jgi:hypothetical protein
MRKAKFDRRTEGLIIRTLEMFVRKHGANDVAHAVNKWNKARMVRKSVEKERVALRKRLRELGEKT